MSRQTVEILPVDDDPNDVELTLRAFAKHRLANRVHVRDGLEALDYLHAIDEDGGTSRPRVVLLDLELPKVDGVEVLRDIRSSGRLRTLPVVVPTSSSEQRDVVETDELGVSSIVEPIEFDEFVETVSAPGMVWLLLNEPPAAAGAGHQ